MLSQNLHKMWAVIVSQTPSLDKQPTKHVTIYSDGACSGNPGPGGWGAVLIYKDETKHISGAQDNTTNNQMELMAAIEGLLSLNTKCIVDIYTDSKYVQHGITEWIQNWKKNGWRTSAKKPVKNKDLWQKLDEAVQHHQVTWHWVKGHSDNEFNNTADELARNAITLQNN